MAYDLLPIEGWNFKFAYTDNDGETQERVAQLVETDQVWVKLVRCYRMRSSIAIQEAHSCASAPCVSSAIRTLPRRATP